jgi:hypothetical protein
LPLSVPLEHHYFLELELYHGLSPVRGGRCLYDDRAGGDVTIEAPPLALLAQSATTLKTPNKRVAAKRCRLRLRRVPGSTEMR